MFAEILRERLSGLVDLSGEQVGALERHYQMLERWNRVLNLTSVRKVEEVVERHYCEAMFLGSHLPKGRLSVVDVGSGAGFPGFPVAILRPECTLTLVESHQRKAVFLKECGRAMANVRVVGKRVEEIGERFDWAVSRAVNITAGGVELKRLAGSAALLAGERSPVEGWEWQERLRLPWGNQRYLWLRSFTWNGFT